MTVLIIEDETSASNELIAILSAIDPEIKVAGILVSIEQSVSWLKQNDQPEVILCDIQLADGLSFEIFDQVSLQCPIIFCTTFDEYVMDAFDTNAIGYLLKPITREKVQGALTKLYNLQSGFDRSPQKQAIKQLSQYFRQSYRSTLLVNQRDHLLPIAVRDIAFFYLDRSLIKIMTHQNTRHFITNTLDDLEKSLDPALFFRANRQFLVGRAAIAAVQRLFTRKLILKLRVETPESIVISKAKATEFLDWLQDPF
jgi:two-component system response regulator LytT